MSLSASGAALQGAMRDGMLTSARFLVSDRSDDWLISRKDPLLRRGPAIAAGAVVMEEVLRTNDPVKLSYACHLLSEAGIDYFVADRHMSAVEGNIGAFPVRLMVAEPDRVRARFALAGIDLR